ncbi:MAG: signal recognition particle-docking protein FtsY [Acidobacteriota bacterium]|jgi:fused signal recognition particle receptor
MMLFSRSKDKGEKKPGFFERMKKALTATKEKLVDRIESVLSGRTSIDANLLEELEGVLLSADLGVKATAQIMGSIRDQQKKQMIRTADEVRAVIRAQLIAILEPKQQPESRPALPAQEVWMIIGVNGTGKTTTVGKLAARFAQEGKRVLICAADTFRPAAIEQLAVWAERSGAEMIKSKIGSDPSAVLHDALAAAEARKCDLVIVDTAGRLHTRSNLMAELEKMRRVAGRRIPGAPHEVLLILDAITGQNGLQQAKEFLKAAGVTGLIVTKLDGTAKGGVLFSIVQELNIPVRYIGVGESLEDLLEFSPESFVDSLFSGTS